MDFLRACLPCLGPNLEGEALVLYNRDRKETRKEKGILKAERKQEKKLVREENKAESAIRKAEEKIEKGITNKEKKEDAERIKKEQERTLELSGEELREYTFKIQEESQLRERQRSEKRAARHEKYQADRAERTAKIEADRAARAAEQQARVAKRAMKRDKKKEKENQKRLDYAELLVSVVREAEPVEDHEWATVADVVFQKETSELPKGAALAAHVHRTGEEIRQYLKDITLGKDVYHWPTEQQPDHVLEAKLLYTSLMEQREAHLAELAAEEEAEKERKRLLSIDDDAGSTISALSSLSKGVKKLVTVKTTGSSQSALSSVR